MATLAAVLAALLVAVSAPTARADDASEAAAVAAAEEWLALIDRGRFDESWEQAAAYLKNAVSKADFVQAVNAVRPPLGETVARELTSKRYTTSLPGVPDGAYVVIQYDTVFENKKLAVETITPMLEADGDWRISGYYIQ